MSIKNKKFLSFVLSFAMVLSILVVPANISHAEGNETLTIVHVNDMHGRVAENAGSKELGFAKLASVVNGLRESDPNVLFLNAGDTFHGTIDVNLTQGEEIVKIMNKMGFDAMTPGNHDFNYGYNRLLELKNMAEFPILGANIIKESDKTSDFEPYVIKEMDNGLKVGIFGLATDETKYKSHPSNTTGIEFADVVSTGEKCVKELKEKGADVIIALVHLGIDESSVNTANMLAEKVEGIDLIVDGHSHHILDGGMLVNDTLIVQAGSYTQDVGFVKLEFDNGKIVKRTAEVMTYEELKETEPDEEIAKMVEELVQKNEPLKNVVVGRTEVKLEGTRELVRTGETNLGNLITDAMRSFTGADFALTNGGGIRASIDEGEITLGEILTAFPFTNTVAVIEVTGEEIWKALEHGVSAYPDPAGHFPHVSGLNYTFDPSKPVGERIVSITINGKPIELEETYTMATNDFLAAGGDGYTMFANKPFVGEGGLLSDVLAEYVALTEMLGPRVEGRIKVVTAPTTPTEPTDPTKPSEDTKHIVQRGENLYRIGLRYNVPWQRLAEYNKLKNPNLIYPGQIILIPAK
ncbi:MAG: 5'-nucleotidase C-terminal domain-containing protein [Tissierellales bacterium]|nr:5'-nucleotidase C-terminal domain-containing protein [Tissierellales bacterium]